MLKVDVTKGFPSEKDEQGWFIENEQDFLVEVFTREDEAGNVFKKTILKGGRVAIVKELTKKEFREASKFAEARNDDKDAFMASLIATCTLVDEKPILMEDILDNFLARDVNRLTIAAKALNF